MSGSCTRLQIGPKRTIIRLGNAEFRHSVCAAGQVVPYADTHSLLIERRKRKAPDPLPSFGHRQNAQAHPTSQSAVTVGNGELAGLSTSIEKPFRSAMWLAAGYAVGVQIAPPPIPFLAEMLERDGVLRAMNTYESSVLISPARTRMEAGTRTGRTLGIDARGQHLKGGTSEPRERRTS
jgi:hypothetical protein